ncbi:MAG: hypothetical protein JWN51_3789, partial [Phycisphaerales bacterium]|nr:hypothetical protein [Phycisphaerales bacterium]
AAAGSTVSVKVYLLESRGANASTIAGEGGLFAAAAGLAEVSGPASGAASFSAVNASSDFGGPATSSVSATSASLQETVASSDPPPPGVPLGNSGGGASPATPANEVYLGTFTITVGTGSTSFSVGAFTDPSFGVGGVTFTAAGSDLDLALNPAGKAIAGLSGAAESQTKFTVSPV